MSFIDRLTIAMKERKITPYRLSKDIGISDSLMSKWQKNPAAAPSADVLKKLSEYFQISIDWLLTGTGEKYKDNNIYISDVEEAQLMDDFKKLDEKDKIRVSERARTLLDLQEAAAKAHKQAASIAAASVPAEHRLNEPEPPEYPAPARAADFSKRPRTPGAYAPEELKTVRMKIFSQKASAGWGTYLFDDDSLYNIEVFGVSEVPFRADFGVKISGDSMEPTIPDGSLVWIKEQHELDSGEIGIFIYDGEAYCKQLKKDYEARRICLISHNKKYDTIVIKNNIPFRTVGKVLL